MSSVAYAPNTAQAPNYTPPLPHYSIALKRTRNPLPDIEFTRAENDVFDAILTLSYGTGECWAQPATIARTAKVATVTAEYAIRKFLRLGFLKRKIHGRQGRRGGRSASVLSWNREHPIWESYQQVCGKPPKKPVARAESTYTDYRLNPPHLSKTTQDPNRTAAVPDPSPVEKSVLPISAKEKQPEPDRERIRQAPGPESCTILMASLRHRYAGWWRGPTLTIQDARDILAELPGELTVDDLLEEIWRRFDPRKWTNPGGVIRNIAKDLYRTWMTT